MVDHDDQQGDNPRSETMDSRTWEASETKRNHQVPVWLAVLAAHEPHHNMVLRQAKAKLFEHRNVEWTSPILFDAETRQLHNIGFTHGITKSWSQLGINFPVERCLFFGFGIAMLMLEAKHLLTLTVKYGKPMATINPGNIRRADQIHFLISFDLFLPWTWHWRPIANVNYQRSRVETHQFCIFGVSIVSPVFSLYPELN